MVSDFRSPSYRWLFALVTAFAILAPAQRVFATPIPQTIQDEPKTESDDDANAAKEEKDGTAATPAASTLPVGRILKRTYDFKAADKEMEYALYLPKEFDEQKTYPLIVALHGLYSNPRQILGYPGLTRGADKYGYILVAPMGYNTRGWYGSRGQGGGRGGDPENLGELSEKDVMNVLGLVRKQFQIDENRIYLYGHSMGGGGSLHLAMTYPEIWAGIAPMAPAAGRNTARLERAKHIPAFVVQGDKDRLVPVTNTRRWVEKMKELEMDHRYIEVKGGDHIFIAFKHLDEIFQFFNKRTKAKSAAATSADN